ncbi:hypothetical protein HK098_001596 [Nowakowskiella sp. JEL0407]|nr:hypothetical protein HK098_001596 [Nowakowskiella sp. JEL0407]
MCVGCCLQIIEEMVQYFNTYAFAQVAIYGKDFVNAAKDTWALVKSHGIDAIINDNLIGNVLFVGSMIAGLICGLIGYIYLLTTTPNATPGVYAIVVVGCIFIGLSEFGVLNTVIDSGVVTTFVSVKQEDFKKCDASSFCKRQRAFYALTDKVPTESYTLLPESVKLSENTESLTGMLHDSTRNIYLDMKLDFLNSGSVVRIKIKESNVTLGSLKPRYDSISSFSLTETLQYAQSKIKSDKLTASDSQLELSFGDNNANSLKIDCKPFRLFFSANGVPVMVFNGRKKFYFEHLREKVVPEVKTEEPALIKEQDASEGGNKEIKVETKELTEDEKIIEQLKKDLEHDMWEEQFGSHRDSKPYGPASVGIDVTFPGSDHLYGLPEHASSLSLKTTRGENAQYSEPFRLYNFDVFEYIMDSPMSLYGNIPFVISQKLGSAAGLLWLNSAEMWVDVEKTKEKGKTSSHLHWMTESGPLDLFVFMGPIQKSILNDYTSLTGRPAMPQLFALAYHQCRWNYLDEADVAEVESNFDKNDIPVDVIWLDIEHTDGKKYFTWDKVKFPNPVEMQNKLAAHGRKMVNIVDPHIKIANDYSVFGDAKTQGLFVKDRSGGVFDGWCWPGNSNWLDYTDPKARKYWADRFALDQYKGTTKNVYIWNDMNEPSVFHGPEVTMPKDNLHYDGVEHREIHNAYGMLQDYCNVANIMTDHLCYHEHSSLEVNGMVQSGQVITQRHGNNSLGQAQCCLVLVLPGCHLLEVNNTYFQRALTLTKQFETADVGGFFGDPSVELLIRWYQAAAYQPFFRAHAHIDTKRREPYLFGDDNTWIIREAIRSRYRIMPYVYTLYFEAHRTGTPVMRPMSMEFPSLEAYYGVDDQFMLGESLLIKPVVEAGVSSVTVKLPKSQLWYDYNTYKLVKPQSNDDLKVDTPLQKIPVFLRGGSILPRRERMRRSSSLMLHDPITLIVALDANGSAKGSLYLDDGKSYDFKNGEYIMSKIEFSKGVLRSKDVRGIYGEKASGSNDLKAKIGNRVERVVVVGYKGSHKNVKPKVGEKELIAQIADTTITVKDPKFYFGEDWEVKIY